MWHKYVNICSLIVYYLTKTWNNFTWQSIWNQRFICKILIAIINESESVAPAYGDDPKEHEDHCRYTVKNRGSRRNRKCAFPFRFEGKLFEGICTNITVAQEYMFKVRTKIKYDCHFSTVKYIPKCYFRTQMESSGAQRGLTKKLASMSGVEDTGDTVSLVVMSNLCQKW